MASEITYAALAKDVGAPDQPARPETIAEYLALLERVFVLEWQPSWGPHLRSRDVARKQPKLHLVDPALAIAGIRASPAALLADLKTFGFIFESLVTRDLRVYAQPLGARVMHYRDSAGTEVDEIVAMPDGTWIAAEVKLGTNQVEAAAASLQAFAAKLDPTRTPLPAALAVFTTGEYAYRRPDGVYVVPITMLGP